MAESVLRPIHVWLNVINALLLRDIRVRAGRFYTGYIVIFLMPFASRLRTHRLRLRDEQAAARRHRLDHLLRVVDPAVRDLHLSGPADRHRPVDEPPAALFSARQGDGRHHRARDPEAANGITVAGVVLLFVFVASGEFEPRDPLGMLNALLLTLYIGIALGTYNSMIAPLVRFWAMAFRARFGTGSPSTRCFSASNISATRIMRVTRTNSWTSATFFGSPPSCWRRASCSSDCCDDSC
jgi:hypothetical protein